MNTPWDEEIETVDMLGYKKRAAHFRAEGYRLAVTATEARYQGLVEACKGSLQLPALIQDKEFVKASQILAQIQQALAEIERGK